MVWLAGLRRAKSIDDGLKPFEFYGLAPRRSPMEASLPPAAESRPVAPKSLALAPFTITKRNLACPTARARAQPIYVLRASVCAPLSAAPLLEWRRKICPFIYLHVPRARRPPPPPLPRHRPSAFSHQPTKIILMIPRAPLLQKMRRRAVGIRWQSQQLTTNNSLD